MKVINRLFRFQNKYSPFNILFDSFQAGLQVKCNRLNVGNNTIMNSCIPKTNASFYKIPYNEQYESRDT